MNKQHPVIVVGGGLSGLSLGYALQQQGVPYRLLESSDRAGGVIQSFTIDGFELDAGPNSIAMSAELRDYFGSLGLQDQIVTASAASKMRFLVRNDRLHGISPHPFKIIGSSFLSAGAKWKLFTEAFRKSTATSPEETVSEFVTRRFGKEIATYVFDPVLSGIYAGDIERLSIQEVMPMLPAWEKQFGSVVKGLMKNKESMGGRKIVTLKGGNAILTNKLTSLVGKNLQLNCKVTGVWESGDAYELSVNNNGLVSTMKASRVIFTAPSYAVAHAIETLDHSLAGTLRQLEYPAMGVLHLGYDKKALPAIPEGFGFLVPAAEKKHFLGVIYNSAIFPFKAPENKVLFTLFIGGAKQQQLLKQPAETLQQQVIGEISALLGIQVQPVMKHFQIWDKAIPQLNVGHAALRAAVERFEAVHPGLHFAGNYMHGVSVPNIIQHAQELAAKIAAEK